MKVKILFFAQLKEAFGCEQQEIEMPEGATVQALQERLAEQDPGALLKELPLLYAINEKYVSQQSLLTEGDTVAFLPPMAGG